MKNALLLIVSLLIVWLVWRIVQGVLVGVFGIIFQLALFCWAVYWVYKQLNRQKIV